MMFQYFFLSLYSYILILLFLWECFQNWANSKVPNNFSRYYQTSLQTFAASYTLTNNKLWCTFTRILTSTGSCILNFCQFDGFKIAPYCSFYLHFPRVWMNLGIYRCIKYWIFTSTTFLLISFVDFSLGYLFLLHL